MKSFVTILILTSFQICFGQKIKNLNIGFTQHSFRNSHYTLLGQIGNTTQSHLKGTNDLISGIFLDISSINLSHTNKLIDQGIHIYPNPVIDFIHIKSTKEALQYLLFDFNGNPTEIHGNIKKNHSHKILLKSLSTGIYILQLQNNKHQTLHFKTIKL